MGKLDKDQFQKETAIQFCLARGLMPFLEVLVQNHAEYTDTNEVLTDIDVLGVGLRGDGDLIRTAFDCKSGSRMSAMNRAFWAAGLLTYTSVDDAFVILKAAPSRNHRLSALRVNVDVHDENSFRDLARTVDPSFPRQTHYQSRLDNWFRMLSVYEKAAWTRPLSLLNQSAIPLTQSPPTVFRKLLAELRSVRGHFDPNKIEHVSIILDTMAGAFVLWSRMARDIRRFYDPKMDKEAFEMMLRYYLWGGREAYHIRQQLSEKAANGAGGARNVELPDWPGLLRFAGNIIAAPQSVLTSGMVCREVAFKIVTGRSEEHEAGVGGIVLENTNARPFAKLLARYLVSSSGLPREFVERIDYYLDDIDLPARA